MKNSPSKFIMYLDANNLHGYAVSQYLSTGGFRWMTQKQIDKINLANYTEDCKNGLILEVDLKYPKNCMICIMIILLLLKNSKLQKICYLKMLKI